MLPILLDTDTKVNIQYKVYNHTGKWNLIRYLTYSLQYLSMRVAQCSVKKGIIVKYLKRKYIFLFF